MRKFTIFIAVALVLWLPLQAQAVQLLVPGGQLIGIELLDDTVTVAAFDEQSGSAAKSAGLQVGDRITAVDGKAVHSAQDVRQALSTSGGGTVEVTVLRDGKVKKLRLKPVISDQGPRLGVYLKQGVSGVGTVTWYDPQTRQFGALGHGVNTGDGALLRMVQGRIYRASVVSVRTGRTGDPGQLMGSLQGGQVVGKLEKNTVQGVFGTIQMEIPGEKLPVAEPDQVRTGPATIRSTVSGDQVREYSVEILRIYPNSPSAGRNMLLKITDPALLEATGGIVQGMGVSYNKDNQWNP